MKTRHRLLRRFPLLLIIILQGLTIAAVQAEEVGWRERPSHLSVIVGYTWEDGEEENTDAEMLGIDYEYRLS